MLHRNLSLPARLLDPDPAADPAAAGNPPANPSGGDPGNPPANANTDASLRAEIDALKAQLQERPAPQSDLEVRTQVYQNLKDRFVASGMSDEDAEVYAIATLTSPQKPTGNQQTTQRQPARNSGGDNGEDGPSAAELEIAQLKAEIQDLRRGVARGETHDLQELFSREIRSALDSTPELATMMKRAGADNADETRKIIMEDLDRLTKDGLRKRREATRSWDNKWIAEEAKKAAVALHKRYRTVIGDPSQLGPSETVAEADRLLASKPVEAPSYKPGMSLGDAQAASRSYAADQIARAMAESAKASETVV